MQKHQVFVCSTFVDLEKERQQLFVALYRNGFIPVGMEGFTPASKGQLEYIRERIDECDYFIVVVAHRFGTTSPDARDGESITEYEYNYAMAKGTIPISRFVIDSKAPWATDSAHMSTGKERQKLERFKARLERTDHDFFATNPWMNSDNLVHLVTTSLNTMRQDQPRPGLVRPIPPSELTKAAENFSIRNIFPGLRDVTKEHLIASSRTIWIVINDGYNFFDINMPFLTEALRSRANVRVLLVHPDSPCMDAIADKSYKRDGRQRAEIVKSIRLLHQHCSGFPNFRMLGHFQYNTYFALITESECLVDFYFNFRLEHGRQDDRIALRCEKQSQGDPLYRRIKDDFENFWRETEHDPKSSLERFTAAN